MEKEGPYFDKFGYLTTKEQDGGDALHREAFARLVNVVMMRDIFGLRRSDEDFVKDFRVEPGLWRRHPDTTKWYSDPWTSTRDQYTPLICWLSLRISHKMFSSIDEVGLLLEIYRLLRSRLWFFPNRIRGWNDGPKPWWEPCDPMTPDLYAILNRQRTWLGDKAMILNSKIKCGDFPSFELGKGIRWGDNTNCDDTGHIAILSACHCSEDANKAHEIYVQGALNPPEPWATGNRVLDRLKYWFRDDWGGNPGFAAAMTPFIEKWFTVT